MSEAYSCPCQIDKKSEIYNEFKKNTDKKKKYDKSLGTPSLLIEYQNEDMQGIESYGISALPLLSHFADQLLVSAYRSKKAEDIKHLIEHGKGIVEHASNILRNMKDKDPETYRYADDKLAEIKTTLSKINTSKMSNPVEKFTSMSDTTLSLFIVCIVFFVVAMGFMGACYWFGRGTYFSNDESVGAYYL